MADRRPFAMAHGKLTDAARVSFATATVALLVAVAGEVCNLLWATQFAAGGLTTIATCYAALGLWNISWRKSTPRPEPVSWRRLRARRASRMASQATSSWEMN